MEGSFMASFSDLSDIPKYTIKAVASLTGIRPVTIRAWERRYGIIQPHRSANRYRLYSDRDIAILRWLKSRIEMDISISSAVTELRSLFNNLDGPVKIVSQVDLGYETPFFSKPEYSDRLYRALVNHDEKRADDIFREFYRFFDLLSICTEILTPSMDKIGESWSHGEVRITTEHFASAFLRGKLLAIMQSYHANKNQAEILVGCAPSERHEIGALMISTLLRTEGYPVIYLGADVPLEDLMAHINEHNSGTVILTATLDKSAAELISLRAVLDNRQSSSVIAFGGRAFNIHPELRDRVPGLFLGETIEVGIETIRSLN
jgi:methanogenic corrinoid protein MtbC1